MLYYKNIEFLLSVHALAQLPAPELPEFAFAGRSNVGKSSLLNRLFNRKGFVKVSGKPGKTQGLNYFQVDGEAYMVDLPGYGYAKVAKNIQLGWQKLITSYLEKRENLCCVVVIFDIRHPPKPHDNQLLNWLRTKSIGYLPVYTKADKLSGNQRQKNAAILDAGHTIRPNDRVIFSAHTGMGLDELKSALTQFL